MRFRRSSALLALLCAGVAGWSCLGTIGDGGEEAVGGPDREALCAKGELPGPQPRLVRLTHAQYDNSVSALLGFELTPSVGFIDDPAFVGFTNNAEKLTVSDRLARDYRRAAEAIAEDLTPAQIEALLPCDIASGDDACVSSFVTDFGRRVYRRPLGADEIAAYQALYLRGDGLFEAGSAFEQGIRHVIEAMLQSPSFLYRVELSEALDGDQLIPLDGYEVASRLSYLLWNGTPDDTLLGAASAGELVTDAGIEAQARRMLDDPRATGPIDDFHAQWLQVSRYDNLTKDDQMFPGFEALPMANAMKEETRRFIRHVILELGADYETLMTSRTTFVDSQLAAIYGLGGTFGTDFEEVELDESRAGLLTQIGFLASHAYPIDPSPIHRGVFIQRRILCTEIPDPPGNVDTNLPEPDDTLKTNRQIITAFTANEPCVGCHSLINEAGYAFENYDAIGAWRDIDNGEPVDATGSIGLDGGEAGFEDAIDLIGAIAKSEDAQQCYLRQWYRYGFARQETDADECTINALEQKLAENGYNIKELLVAFTLTKTFRFRIGEEVSQ
jgi:uncharacterized protein DUF1592/uncharacterized protein DUF1588/uncharacterized protein DUF1595/uncharacterized protein DUF1587/uncharacterized protein DUF1585